MKPTTAEPTTNGAEQAPAIPPLTLQSQPLTPRQRQRMAEDAIAEIEARYNVRVLGVVKTVSGGQQVITWEVVALPDKSES